MYMLAAKATTSPHPKPFSGIWPRTFLLTPFLYYIYMLAAKAINPQSNPAKSFSLTQVITPVAEHCWVLQEAY